MAFGKVLIIDDSILVRNYLSKTIANIPNLEVVGTVSSGRLGFQKIQDTNPDVVILDLEMLDGDGLYVLQNIEDRISFGDRPFVLIYSSRAHFGDPVFKKAIDFGFCDFVLKIEGTAENIIENIKSAFVLKILSGIEAKKTRLLLNTSSTKTTLNTLAFNTENKNSVLSEISEGLEHLTPILKKKHIKPQLLLLGASTGGPRVVRSILKNIDSDINIPIAIIQHMPEKFTKSFALELANCSQIPVHEIKHNMSLEKGHAYVFPGGVHGRLNAFGNLYVYYTDRNDYTAHPFKPSINLAIEHLINSFTGHVIGAILSGMGSDGASGMKKLHDTGSLIFAQNKESSAVWGMPGAAVAQKGVDLILNQEELGLGIIQALTYYDVHPSRRR